MKPAFTHEIARVSVDKRRGTVQRRFVRCRLTPTRIKTGAEVFERATGRQIAPRHWLERQSLFDVHVDLDTLRETLP